MFDLLAEAGGRQHTEPDVGTVRRRTVGPTTLGEIGGDAPAARVDPLE